MAKFCIIDKKHCLGHNTEKYTLLYVENISLLID